MPYALILTLVLALVFDVRRRIIPNWLTFSGLAVGIAGHFIMPGWAPLELSLLGFAFGFAALLPFFWVGGMGGGDVKLMAAVGALQSWPDVFFSLCYGGFIGGLIAVTLLIYNGRLIQSFKNIGRTVFTILHPSYKFVPIRQEETIQFPYGVALAAGTFLRIIEIHCSPYSILHF